MVQFQTTWWKEHRFWSLTSLGSNPAPAARPLGQVHWARLRNVSLSVLICKMGIICPAYRAVMQFGVNVFRLCGTWKFINQFNGYEMPTVCQAPPEADWIPSALRDSCQP